MVKKRGNELIMSSIIYQIAFLIVIVLITLRWHKNLICKYKSHKEFAWLCPLALFVSYALILYIMILTQTAHLCDTPRQLASTAIFYWIIEIGQENAAISHSLQ